MTVIIKVSTIQIGLFQGSQKLRVWRGYKKVYVGFREIRLEKIWKRLKNTKIEHQFNQISLTSTIIIRNFWSYRCLALLSNFKSGAEITAFSLFGKYFADVSKIDNCDFP